jgi:maleate isomerase
MAGHFTSWRGSVGLVVPTKRPGIIEEIIRYYPPGVASLPVYVDIRRGTLEELRGTMPAFEERIAELVEVGVDLVHAGGAPPFLVQGYERERRIVADWEQRFEVPIYTTPMADCEALRALGVRRFVGITYFTDDVNQVYEAYFRAAGFDCLGMAAIGVPFNQMHTLAPTEVYRFARQTLLANPQAEAIYLLGAWRAESILELLESDFQIPAILSIVANGWALQKRMHIRQPMTGYGKLMRELP